MGGTKSQAAVMSAKLLHLFQRMQSEGNSEKLLLLLCQLF